LAFTIIPPKEYSISGFSPKRNKRRLKTDRSVSSGSPGMMYADALQVVACVFTSTLQIYPNCPRRICVGTSRGSKIGWGVSALDFKPLLLLTYYR
jgi:hypothetical protein